jgi:hypothetical protein
VQQRHAGQVVRKHERHPARLDRLLLEHAQQRRPHVGGAHQRGPPELEIDRSGRDVDLPVATHDTKVVAAGRVSVTLTSSAALGPALVTVMV